VRRSRDQDDVTPAFPGYSQLREIGGGGFSTVYQATEDATGRFVALKVLRVAGRSPQVVEAFDREVRALGALSSHPNIVTLYRTLATNDGRPFRWGSRSPGHWKPPTAPGFCIGT
jgi:serine/threonine protein kinase